MEKVKLSALAVNPDVQLTYIESIRPSLLVDTRPTHPQRYATKLIANLHCIMLVVALFYPNFRLLQTKLNFVVYSAFRRWLR
ncbi:unnamed protein product [Schistocephalus solidus]|uniref:Uncharacterized protein n=1 Tax=Schistocephalus solidus TaxID=70667 RepID=A0A3P7DL16_SCHSO|nr:unnamed protein product [Schistocephalus solidus]